MTNTRNQEIDSTLKEHGKAISNLQETLAAMLKQQEQSMKQQEEILRALKEHSSGGSFSGGGGGPDKGLFSDDSRTGTWKTEDIIVVDENINNDNSIVALHETVKKLQPFIEDTVLHKGRKHRDTLCIILANGACEEPKTRLYNVVKAGLLVPNSDAVPVRQGLHVKYGRKFDTLPDDDIIDVVNNNLFGACLKAKASSVNDWRPPWRITRISPIAIGRTEWRPPWNESTQKNSWMLHFFFSIL